VPVHTEPIGDSFLAAHPALPRRRSQPDSPRWP